jgi:hypothetical protein
MFTLGAVKVTDVEAAVTKPTDVVPDAAVPTAHFTGLTP